MTNPSHFGVIQTGAGANPVAMPGATFSPGDANIANNLNVQGALNLQTSGNLTTQIVAANPAAARVDTVPDAGANAYFVLTAGSANGQVAKAKEFTINPGSGAALANSTTLTYLICPGRAGVVNEIAIACKQAPSTAGSALVTVSKNGSTNVLSATNFDLSTLTAYVAQFPALASGVTFATTDTLVVTIVTTTQGANTCQAPCINIEMLPNDY